MKRGLVVLCVIGAAAVALGVLFQGPSGGSTPKYRRARVERGTLTITVSASGAVNPVTTVQVGSQLSGQLKAIHVDYNSPVKKGQVLALIAPETFETKVNQARADLQNSQGAVLSQRALVQRARAEIESARAALAMAEAQTAKAEVASMDARRDHDRKQELFARDLIARSERDTAQAVLDSALAQLHSSRAQERALAAAIESAEAQLDATRAQLQSAQATVEQRRAALAQAQVDVANTLIRAPVDGIVVSRNVDVGQTVAASLQAPTLFTIAQDLSRMQVETNILEADIGRVRVGQPATFTVDAFPGATFEGAVTQIRQAPQISQGVVSYNVVVSAPNRELRLMPGMTANVKIVTTERTEVVKIPVAALRVRPPADEWAAAAEPTERDPSGDARRANADRPSRQGGAAGGVTGRVFVLEPSGQPRPVAVRLGPGDGAAMELLSGDLREGDEIIVGLADRRTTRGVRGIQVRF